MAENDCTKDLNEASLLLDRLHAVLDSIYTLACADKIEGLSEGALASVLDCSMTLCSQAKDIVDGKGSA